MALAVGDQDKSDLQSIQLELNAVISGAKRAQESLAQAALDADARTKALQAKIEDLEAQNLERAFKIRALKQENAELRERLAGAASAPDLDVASLGRIVEERDRALRHLAKAQKMLKKMMRSDEVNVKHCIRCGASQQTQSDGRVTHSKSRHPQRVDSDDESTIRPSRSAASTHGRGTPAPLPSTMDRPSDACTAPRTPVSSQESTSTISSTSTVSDTPSSASRAAAKMKVEWYLEFDKSPATVEVRHGPIPFDILSQQLALDELTEEEIGCLESIPGYDTRIHPREDVAFVFRPIVLEGPAGTYFIGWGSPREVKRVEEWTKTLGDMNLLIWPLKQDAGWFYVGLHSLTYVELEPVWPKLQNADKQRLLAELSERNPGLNTAQFRKDVREGKLVQCCLELESKGRMESLDFLREHGLLEGD